MQYFFNVDPISIWLANEKALKPELLPMIKMVGEEYDKARPGTVVKSAHVGMAASNTYVFNMLSGTLVPNGGSVRFEGREIGGQPPHRIINLGIGRTFQIPRPFHRLSILENVMLAGFYGQGPHSRARAFEAAQRALELVGLSTDRAAVVDGLGAAALTSSCPRASSGRCST